MAITYEAIKTVSARLYERSLKRIPEDTKDALLAAGARERNPTALHTLRLMIRSAEAAQQSGHFVCSDAGIPVYFVRVGTQARFSGSVRAASRRISS